MAQCLRERADADAGAFLCEQNLSFSDEIADHYPGIDSGKAIIDGRAEDISPDEVRSALLF